MAGESDLGTTSSCSVRLTGIANSMNGDLVLLAFVTVCVYGVIRELSKSTTDESTTVKWVYWYICACINFAMRRSSRSYNVQRVSQQSWWRRRWCFTVIESSVIDFQKLPIILDSVSHTKCYIQKNAFYFHVVISCVSEPTSWPLTAVKSLTCDH